MMNDMLPASEALNPTLIIAARISSCGPGLYSTRLARLGHTCVGIDFSPASIRYARETAEREELACTFRHEDIRSADYGSGYNLAMLIFGEINVFCP